MAISAALKDFVEILGAGDHAEGEVIEESKALSHCEVSLHVR